MLEQKSKRVLLCAFLAVCASCFFPPRLFAQQSANPSDLLLESKTISIRSRTVFFKPIQLMRALSKRSELDEWGLSLMDTSDGSDLVIEIDHILLTYDFPFKITHRETGIVIASGKVITWDGTSGAEPMAKRIIERLTEVRNKNAKAMTTSQTTNQSGKSSDAENWIAQSPLDQTFRLELPTPMRAAVFFDGKNGELKQAVQSLDKHVACYMAEQAAPKNRQYGILMIHLTSELRQRFQDNGITDFGILIGGEDALPTSVTEIEVKGTKWTEYFYANQVAPKTYVRGRIHDDGSFLYILILRTKNVEDLASSAATRFFDTFQIKK
jgi:hypothetical protein